jgi:DNA-binding CsgD family transcriptional regulator
VKNPSDIALGLVGPIYDAAGDPSLWPDVLDHFAHAVEGTTTGFTMHAVPARPGGSVALAINMDPSFQPAYEAYYHSLNLHVSRFSKLSSGAIGVSHHYLGDQELTGSEYYQDFLRRHDVFHLMGAVVAQQAGLLSSLWSYRPLHAGPFSDEAVDVLKLLLPHFQRAAKLQNKLGASHAGLESLDSLAVGVLVVHSDGWILQMNQYARELLSASDGLSLVFGHLAAWNLREKAEMLGTIRQASMAAMGNGLAGGGTLTVHRPSGKRPYILFVSPLRSSLLLCGKQKAGAVVFVIDPEREPEVDEEALMRIHGLTPSQARLAAALARGRDLDQYCDEASIGRNTARTHLRLLFEKLGVKRQAELVALLMRTLGLVQLPKHPK